MLKPQVSFHITRNHLIHCYVDYSHVKDDRICCLLVHNELGLTSVSPSAHCFLCLLFFSYRFHEFVF